MFFVLTKRVIRYARLVDPSDRFSARTDNVMRWDISGPFARRPAAERAARMAMGVHNCVAAQVVDVPQIDWMIKDLRGHEADHHIKDCLRYAKQYLIGAPVCSEIESN